MYSINDILLVTSGDSECTEAEVFSSLTHIQLRFCGIF